MNKTPLKIRHCGFLNPGPLKVEMTRRLETQCHAELVSAPHLLSIHHAGHLSCGVLKQVQDDFLFIICHGQTGSNP